MSDRHQKKPYPLRLPDTLRAMLEDSAEKMGRSLNAEISYRLEESFAAVSFKAIYEASETASIEDLLEMQRVMIGRHSGESLFLHGVIRARLGILDKPPQGDDSFQN